jgi:hypothetical protein
MQGTAMFLHRRVLAHRAGKASDGTLASSGENGYRLKTVAVRGHRIQTPLGTPRANSLHVQPRTLCRLRVSTAIDQMCESGFDKREHTTQHRTAKNMHVCELRSLTECYA